jgi:capsular exopolysaccharide synthesis family protein
VLLVTLAAVGGSLLYLSLREEEYEATANLLVTPLPQDDQTFLGLQLLRDSGDPTRTIQTAATLVESPAAARATAERVNRGMDADDVLEDVEVQAEGESNILAVTATADSPRRAARLANEFARAALEVRQRALDQQVRVAVATTRAQLDAIPNPADPRAAELAARLTRLQTIEGGEDPTLALSEEATPPEDHVGAPRWLVVALALVAGLALGTGAALLLELFERRLRDDNEILAVYPLPILARVPLLRRRQLRGPKHAGWFMPPAIREAFRTLAVQLDLERSGHRSIMITSASTGDGKTTSAVNLAVAMAAAGSDVVLLDFDLRKPDVGKMLKLEGMHQIDLLDHRTRLSELLVPAPAVPTLSVLPMVTVAGDFALVETIHQKLIELLAEARETADYVVIDTPPLGEVSDALRVAPHVDDIVVVARANNTESFGLLTLADLLERSRHEPKGYVLLDRSKRKSSYYSYGVTQRGSLASSEVPRDGRRRRGSAAPQPPAR